MTPQIPRALFLLVAVLVLASATGMVLLWPPPPPAPPPSANPVVDGVVRGATEIPCPTDTVVPVTPPCLLVDIELLAGPDVGETFQADTGEQGLPPLAVGNRVKVYASQGPDGLFYSVADFDRLESLTWLVGLFVVTVLAASRWHGLRSLVGLAFSLLVVSRFVVPAILGGANTLAVAMVGAFVVMLVTLYLAHGFNTKTTTALVGTTAALCLTALLGVAFTQLTKLTGLSTEDARLLVGSLPGVDLSGLVLAGLIIAALGVLDDVTVSQAATVFAVHDADPRQGWSAVFRRAMSVGRDHIASTVNTLVLAYAGASIPLLLLFSLGGQPFAEIVNSELVAEEIVQTLVGSIGLIAAVPLTTALAATLAVRQQPSPAEPAAEDHQDPDYEGWVRSLGRRGDREP